MITERFHDDCFFKITEITVESLFEFVDKCRYAGINIPIIPGLKIISSAKQINSLPKKFNISLPDQLVDEIQKNPKHTKEIGLNWGVEQCRKLIEKGVKCIHFYILNDAETVTQLISRI